MPPRLIPRAFAFGTLFLFAHPAVSEESRSPLTLDMGGGVSVTLYGYIKADFIWDDGYDLGRTTSGIKSIGLPNGPEAGDFDRQQLNETRIGFDVVGPNDVFARFEGDFYGADNDLRLRHAYVSWHGLMIGQNWTNFMSVKNLAPTVDFQGAGALPFARTPQVRYTYDGISDVILSASVEEDIANSDDYAYTLAIRYGFDLGMVRASGLWRDTVIAGGALEGWGVNLATVLTPWSGGKLQANVTTGEGISDILAAGLTGDALLINGSAVGVNAAALSLSHDVTDRLMLAATASWLKQDEANGADTEELTGLHLSAFYTVFRNTTLMAEYYTGTRQQGDGISFDADRVQLAVKYAF
ncbi:DcaP family trimeric outer membrane transporter [Sedimentitalea sp. JM2-8]|uniref:DcaP family trimeric outer membrane transporter n=1 Tax=Sedimentitalea xiamensis TaxID=3050037 RepID=A0ABT7FFV0_9RHOB|nr:DcaP family trimeric outer membrane transporter [Sedimentitalea xiamensis]MDK3074001.1 DcaP family trimeric outer membrane transporter [Sedimentitalea xiamensis]